LRDFKFSFRKNGTSVDIYCGLCFERGWRSRGGEGSSAKKEHAGRLVADNDKQLDKIQEEAAAAANRATARVHLYTCRQMLGVARATRSQIIVQGSITIFCSETKKFPNKIFVLLEQLKNYFKIK